MRTTRRLAGLLALAVLATGIGPIAAGASRPGQTTSGVLSAPGQAVQLLAGPAEGYSYIPPATPAGGEVGAEAVTINVNYTGFTPQAQAAFQKAVDLWEQQLTSTVPIDIDAGFAPLGTNVLAQASPGNIWANFVGAPQTDTWYPSALANELHGSDLGGTDPYEGHVTLSSSLPNFYFGTDGNAPNNTYDFVTVALHEIAHALGFVGSMYRDTASPCPPSNTCGFWGFGSQFPGPYPAVYDRFTENSAGTSLLDPSFGYGTTALKAQLQATTGVFFDGPATTAANSGTPARLFAPSTFNAGSSYSHLDDATYPQGNPNSLMTSSLNMGEVIFDPGPVTRGIFEDMGWPLPVAPDPPTGVTAAAGSNQATVSFAAPVNDGGSAITSYTVTASPGGATATGAGTPIIVTGLDNGTPYTFTVRATNLFGDSVESDPSPAPETPVLNGFVPLDPVRILDTRFGDSPQCPTCQDIVGARNATAPTTVQVEGDPLTNPDSPVPADATAIVMNVTATTPTKSGWLTVWDTGGVPTASNLNFVAGQTVPNLVTVKLDSNGDVQLGNSLGLVGAGTVQVIIDVVGYYTEDGTGEQITAVDPTRILDTRFGVPGMNTRSTPLAPQEELNVNVADPAIPAGAPVPLGATAAIINVTATGPTAPGWLAVWPEGAPPTASNLNFVAGQTAPNLVVVKLDSGGAGTVRLGNTTPGAGGGAVNVIFDVVGWIGPSGTDGGLTPITPVRILDTRFGVAGANTRNTPLNPQEKTSIQVSGYGGVPATGVGAVVLNVTVTGPTKAGWLTIWPQATNPPTASNLNFAAGQTVANLVVVELAPDGTVRLGNTYGNAAAGFTNVIFDVVGWYATPPGP